MARRERRTASVARKVVEPLPRTGGAIRVATGLPKASAVQPNSAAASSATIPPANKSASRRELNAERALIGALLLDHAAYARVAGAVTSEDFSEARHATIFAAIQDLAATGGTIEPVTVCDRLDSLGQLETAGDTGYVADLAESAASASNVVTYARLVRSHATLRQLREITQRLTAGATDEGDVGELLAELANAISMLKIRSTASTLILPSLDEFAQRSAVSWLIRDLLPAGAIAVFYGAPKSGKTNVVLDMLLHAAHGLRWHGRSVTKPLRVAYLIGEGQTGLRTRIHAWIKAHPTETRPAWRVLPEAVPLTSRVSELINALQGFKPDVIAIDTLNAYFGDLDENATADMTTFMASVRRLRDELGCAVIVVHHVGHADSRRERGSSVLRGAADVMIQVARDENSGDGHIGVQVVAARDMETWEEPLSLRLVSADTEWTDDQGETITTCLIASGDRPVSLRKRSARAPSPNQHVVITIVNALATQRANGANKALVRRTELVAIAQRAGASRTGAYRAIEKLAKRMGWREVESGLIEVPVQ
jgi:KaiC/GvpD/RAD55 family RecA-like ATPase